MSFVYTDGELRQIILEITLGGDNHELDIKECLDEKPERLNMKDGNNNTVIVAASIAYGFGERHKQIFDFLLEKEYIDVNAEDHNGQTAINVAQLTANSELIEKLEARLGRAKPPVDPSI